MEKRLRLRFSKTGNAKFISHLDLLATMRRALLRAGTPLQYSEGFNPHPYLSVALPLPIGCGSECELMDVGVARQFIQTELSANMNASLPGGIGVLEVYEPNRKFSEISWVEISGVLYYDKGVPPGAAERLAERFRAGSIVVSKKTKRNTMDFDIAPFIRNVVFHENGGLIMKAAVFAQNPTINPDNLLGALRGEYSDLAPDFASFTRMEVFDGEMNVFR